MRGRALLPSLIGPVAAVGLAILGPIALVAGTWPVWTLLGLAGLAATYAGVRGMYWTATHDRLGRQ